jgi:hypothetical protein
MCYKPYDCNNEERFRERIKWCQKFDDLQHHQTLLLDINDGVQAIITVMVQGWIKEVKRNFNGASWGGSI